MNSFFCKEKSTGTGVSVDTESVKGLVPYGSYEAKGSLVPGGLHLIPVLTRSECRLQIQ